MLEEMVAVNPRWHSGILWVIRAVYEDPNGIERVAGVMLYLLGAKKFTNSCRVAVGISCRYLVAAPSVGLAPLVDITRGTHGVANQHLNCFLRLDVKNKTYMAVAAVSVYPRRGVFHWKSWKMIGYTRTGQR